MNRHTGIAVLLILFGAMILSNKLGFHFGHHIMGFLFPAAMVAFGFVGIKNGRTLIGSILVLIGGLILLGKMSGLIGIAVAVGLICFGISMLKRKSSVY